MFALDIRGHLNSLRLAESKALWPLFEAVVNSIQSIEDSPNRDNGKITIFAQREDQDPNLTIQKDVLERFESFVIEKGIFNIRRLATMKMVGIELCMVVFIRAFGAKKFSRI